MNKLLKVALIVPTAIIAPLLPIVGLGALASRQDAPPPAPSLASVRPPAAEQKGGPEAQVELVRSCRESAERYRAAQNQLQKSALRPARAGLLQGALSGQRNFFGWVGTLDHMATDRDGMADVRIAIWPCEPLVSCGYIGTVAQTRIAPGPLYTTLAAMREGDRVEIAGTFLPGRDFVREESITEHGSMTDPFFAAEITAIKPVP